MSVAEKKPFDHPVLTFPVLFYIKRVRLCVHFIRTAWSGP